jgi:uroporphyrinogen decarboxylase
MVLDYLLAQARAGAQVLQLFDSWVGALAPQDYEERVLPYLAPVFEGLKAAGVPSIHFGTGTAGLLSRLRQAGGDVIGLDWRVDLAQAWREVGYDRGVQGNLDPAALLAPWPELERRALRILDAAAGRAGHIFNLGHGVLPDTPVDQLRRLCHLVQTRTAEDR